MEKAKSIISDSTSPPQWSPQNADVEGALAAVDAPATRRALGGIFRRARTVSVLEHSLCRAGDYATLYFTK